MKRIHTYLFTLILLAGVASCSDDSYPSRAISVNDGETFLSLDALARSGELTVDATAPWTVTREAADTWFTLASDHGSTGTTKLGIRFDANDGPARSAVLTFTCGKAVYPFRVSQGARNVGFDEADHYFYITFGTLPTLYAGLHVLSHDKPSYVFYQRLQTFDPTQFPAHATVLSPSGNSIATEQQMEQMRERVTSRIREINNSDPTAVFGLYVDDLRSRVGYDWFVAQGIDSARVRVSLLSDGTGTYNNFNIYFGDPATAEQNWNTYAAQVEALDWDHAGRYPETRDVLGELDSPTWAFYMATLPGYRLLLQNKALLEPSDAFMQTRLAAMNAQSVQPFEVLQSLPPARQEQFYRMASFDRSRFATMFDASPKPNLVIIGTNASGLGIQEQQEQYVAQVAQKYGTQYDLFFKPHPADTAAAGYEERFPGLKLLPGQMPFEIFVWSLLDRIGQIGGYPSTVFMTVPTDKVGFIFAPNAASLVSPLNILFRDASDIDWIQ